MIMLLLEDYSLQSLNTFGIEARARYFARFGTVETLQELLEDRHVQSAGHFILGGGSNILLVSDIAQAVLKNEVPGIERIAEDTDHVYLRAGAGENWHRFVQYCIEQELGGVENLSLIPGNVGASPMQNIGAYGVEIKDVFHELTAFHIKDRAIVKFSAADCAFGYRESVFKRQYRGQFVILDVSFRLRKKPVLNTSYGAIEQELERMGVQQPDIRSISEAVIHIRSSKLPDPAEIGNAGSFFKNPEVAATVFETLKSKYPQVVGYPLADGRVKLAAGWLIEQCGWKGFRRGDAGCHARQALVLVNYGGATGQEIYTLSTEIIRTVQEKFGVILEREVNLMP
jgi:UDP-N-acetylmuramate dehydrogenase